MDKKEIAAIFEEVADLLELKSENPFRVRAYRNAARSLLNSDQDLKKMAREGGLEELEGIGKDLAEKITQLVETGRLPFYEKLKRSIPSSMLKLRQVQGLGPKKVQALHKKLKIKSLAQLKKAGKEGKIAKLKGFGVKTEQNILQALEHHEAYQKRYLWWDAMGLARPLLEGLKKLKGVKRVEIAGSLRRKLETVGDLDILVAALNPKLVVKWFTSCKEVSRILAQGETKVSVRLKEGIQVDLRIVSESQFAFALCYFTGSKEHNIKIRQHSLKKGWSLSEYGFEPIGKKSIAAFKKKRIEEEDIYKALSLPYIEPELRENLGEIEAAEKGKLPCLVEEEDIKGTFHNHTTASDGKSNLKEMVRAAAKMGWEYFGISDHSKSSVQANGLSEERLFNQIEEIRKINRSGQFEPYVFAGTECDILPDGTLDFSDSLLNQLDFVIASIHSALTQDEKTMTKRIIRAVEHPSVTMLGHLTGRLLLKREPYKVNVQKVIDACIANHKIIELNGNPQRLDMDWRLWRAAAERGLLCCINIDAHAADQLQFIKAGVNIARKGWLEKESIINTLSLKKIKNLLSFA